MTYEKLEEMRIRLRNAYLLGGTITVVATTVFILIFKAPELILFGLVAGLLLTMLCTKNKSREYSLAYKDFFVKKSPIKYIYKFNISTRTRNFTFNNRLHKHDEYG